MLSFRLTKQTSKNIADTTFNGLIRKFWITPAKVREEGFIFHRAVLRCSDYNKKGLDMKLVSATYSVLIRPYRYESNDSLLKPHVLTSDTEIIETREWL